MDEALSLATVVVLEWFRALQLPEQLHRVSSERFEDLPPASRVWGLKMGSARVFILLTPADAGARLKVLSPILRLPADTQRPAFFEELLRLNATAVSACAFGINDDDEVIVTTDRSTLDLNVDELNELIISVSENADLYDNLLSDQFGAEMLGEDPAPDSPRMSW